MKNKLLTLEQLKKIDKKEMYKVYDNWPKIARDSFNLEINQINYEGINHIVFAGMGGSGAIGDVISSLLSQKNIHVSVIKGYELPKTVNQNTLVVVTSVSGDTIETINAINQANEKKSNIIAFSSGGKIGEYCLKNNIEFCKIEQLHSPRASFTKFLYSILKVLNPILRVEINEIEESIKSLEDYSRKISSSNLNKSNPALQLAMDITGIPLIYYPDGLKSTAIRFKNSLQENAKQHVIIEDVIEACHNGIVAWEKTSNIQPILLQGKNDHQHTKERWEILKTLFKNNGLNFKEIISVEGSILTKIITLMYFFDYASIYKSVLSEIDPSPIKSIDFIKSQL